MTKEEAFEAWWKQYQIDYMIDMPTQVAGDSWHAAIAHIRENYTIAEKEPSAWMVHTGEVWNTPVCPYIDERGLALYREAAK
jgi:hypothetical protein